MLKQMTELYNEGNATNKQLIYCISGPPGSGKSTVVLRISRELIKKGHDVFLFRGESKLDFDAIKWALGNFLRPIFIFDGMADYSDELGKLALDCSVSKDTLVTIGTERTQRMQNILQGINAEFLMAGSPLLTDILTDTDITRIIDKLMSQKRIGILTRESYTEKKKYFTKFANRQLFVAMSNLEGGKGFSGRIKSEYANIQNNIHKSIYKLSCITYSLGYRLPLAIACTATGANPADILSNINNGELAGVMTCDTIGLKPRHRTIASLIVETVMNSQDRYEMTMLLTKTLSPYISPRTISQRTYAYKIVRRLMDQELISDWIGRGKAREWYEAIEQLYKWNARFWEQRALLEANLGHFPVARSFAEEAIKIKNDTFTLNTLGTILTRMALEFYAPDSKEAHDIFWEGLKHLREARDIRDDKNIHPYSVFFSRVYFYAKTLYVEKKIPIDDRLTAEWNNWTEHAAHSPLFMHTDTRKLLEDFKTKWLLLATK